MLTLEVYREALRADEEEGVLTRRRALVESPIAYIDAMMRDLGLGVMRSDTEEAVRKHWSQIADSYAEKPWVGAWCAGILEVFVATNKLHQKSRSDFRDKLLAPINANFVDGEYIGNFEALHQMGPFAGGDANLHGGMITVLIGLCSRRLWKEPFDKLAVVSTVPYLADRMRWMEPVDRRDGPLSTGLARSIAETWWALVKSYEECLR